MPSHPPKSSNRPEESAPKAGHFHRPPTDRSYNCAGAAPFGSHRASAERVALLGYWLNTNSASLNWFRYLNRLCGHLLIPAQENRLPFRAPADRGADMQQKLHKPGLQPLVS